MTTFHDFSARSLSGEAIDFGRYRGKLVLVVNTASACGFTPQYAGLEALYRTYRLRGFEVLGFPCNQFGGQEPGDAAQIAGFCQANFGVTFPMFEKTDVNGEQASPLFRWLTENAPGLLGTKAVKWNFTKFLVNPEGQVVRRYAPQVAPESLQADIEALLP
ncbi:MAG: glutathione peroxidase [Betaproteobacteria bacterium]|nr:glutathione peroxidase [Betaproteobacteria bacterium]MDE2354917.1 glutathione peroxidase [Betaproteobacteria bacterium]